MCVGGLSFDVLQLRGKEVLRIQNFKAASQEDVAAVHAMGYVKGLERVSSLCADRVMFRLLTAKTCPVDESDCFLY